MNLLLKKSPFVFLLLLSLFGVQDAEPEKPLTCRVILSPDHFTIPGKASTSVVLIPISLEVTNISENPILFNAFYTPELILVNSAGKKFGVGISRDGLVAPHVKDLIYLLPKKSATIPVPCSLLCVKGALCLRGRMNDGGEWSIWHLESGSYKLALHYESFPAPSSMNQANMKPWSGELLTESVNFILTAATQQ